MAIRFECPSCHQPIEIEDDWAGRSVACCYCHQVVTAPRESTWSSTEVPIASPASPQPLNAQRETAGRPSGPWDASAEIETTDGGPSGGWALTLSVAGAILATLGWLVWMGTLAVQLEEHVGPDATQSELMQATQELLASGEGYRLPPAAVVLFLVGLVCGVVGLVLAIRVLLSARQRRGTAIAACIIGAAVSFCQILPLLSALAARSMTGSP